MNSFKRQVSPGAAVVVVVMVLALVQWAWWRGLIYKAPTKPSAGSPPAGAPGAKALTLQGHEYVEVKTVAGAIEVGYVDGPGYAARFDRPTGIALDRTGKLYVCDTGNHRIRVVSQDGSVSTFAGGEQGYADGPALQAKFNAPCGICIAPDGAVYVADTGNACVRCIRNGLVTTVTQRNAQAMSLSSPLPVAVAYQAGPTPHLTVLDAGLKTISSYDANGKQIGSPIHSGSVVIAENADNAGYKPELPAVLQIDGTEEMQGDPKRPVLRDVTGWCHIGPGVLLTDPAHAAVFYMKNASAEVLAGTVCSGGPIRGWRDGNGEKALFENLTSVVSDGVRYAYLSDTGNNCIRRITLPDFMFH